jgi:hypothetical protein
MKSCHISLNIVHSSCRLNNFKTPFTHSLRILPPQQSPYLQADTQSSTPIYAPDAQTNDTISICHASPPQLHSEYNTQKTVQILTSLSIMQLHSTFISSSYAPPFPDHRFSAINAHVSVPYVNTHWAQALHIYYIKIPISFFQSIIQCMQAH